MTEPVEVTIAKINAGDGGDVVRLDIRQGQHCVARVEMTLETYARAQFGEGCVAATLTKGRGSKPALGTALIELLQYTGGWDLTDPEHPIVKARLALERAGIRYE